MHFSLLGAVCCDITVVTEEIWAVWAMQDHCDLPAERTHTAIVVLGLIDPQRDHELLFLVLVLLLFPTLLTHGANVVLVVLSLYISSSSTWVA